MVVSVFSLAGFTALIYFFCKKTNRESRGNEIEMGDLGGRAHDSVSGSIEKEENEVYESVGDGYETVQVGGSGGSDV